MKIAALLILPLLALTAGCKKSTPVDPCVPFVQKLAACLNVPAGDPQIDRAVKQCQGMRAAEGKANPEQLAKDDAESMRLIQLPCNEFLDQA